MLPMQPIDGNKVFDSVLETTMNYPNMAWLVITMVLFLFLIIGSALLIRYTLKKSDQRELLIMEQSHKREALLIEQSEKREAALMEQLREIVPAINEVSAAVNGIRIEFDQRFSSLEAKLEREDDN
jgi:hypothetical protein